MLKMLILYILLNAKRNPAGISAGPLNYLKTRFPSVQATQVSLENDMDLITKEDIRICSAHLFLSEFI